jgi:hypothetical protein
MSKNTGRTSSAYKQAAAEFKTGRYPCWLRLPGCAGIGRTCDHDPPLSTFADPRQWTGTYRPACQPCQSRQGASITNSRHTWRW